MLSRFGIVLVMVCCVSVRSAAQWTLAGYIGEAHTQDSSLAIRQSALGTDVQFSNISYRGESFQPPLYYGLRTGYNFARYWGVEAEFTHLKVFAKVDQPSLVTGTLNGAPINAQVPMNTIVQRFSISHGVNLLLANAVFRHEFGRITDEKVAPAYFVLRAGAGATIPHPESTIQGLADEHYQVGSPAFQLGGSIEVRVWHRLYWSGEYKFTRTHEHVDVNSGTADDVLQSHHVVTGPVIHF